MKRIIKMKHYFQKARFAPEITYMDLYHIARLPEFQIFLID